jgi:hypothetical protein
MGRDDHVRSSEEVRGIASALHAVLRHRNAAARRRAPVQRPPGWAVASGDQQVKGYGITWAVASVSGHVLRERGL